MTYVLPFASSLLRSDSGLGDEIKVHCSCGDYPVCITHARTKASPWLMTKLGKDASRRRLLQQNPWHKNKHHRLFTWTINLDRVCIKVELRLSGLIRTASLPDKHKIRIIGYFFNLLNTELNPICHLLVLLGAHHILHVSGLRVKN